MYVGQRVLRCRKCSLKGANNHPSQYCYVVVNGSRPLEYIPCVYLSDTLGNREIAEAAWEEVDP